MDPRKAVLRSDSATSQSPPGSPFVKKVENILQVGKKFRKKKQQLQIYGNWKFVHILEIVDT